MRVAVTGVSGFIGSYTAAALVRAGHTVTGLLRTTSRRDHIEDCVDRFVVGDQADPTVWPDLLDGADCVVHNSVDWKVLKSGRLQRHLEQNLLASIRLLDESRRDTNPRQFIFLSTIAVHHDILPRWGGVIDEDHPMRPASLYGAYKAAMEAHLWHEHFEHGTPTTALRPCAVYGIDPKLPRSVGHPMVERIRTKRSYHRPGGGKFVHVEDVAAAIVACIGNERAFGRVFNLADCYARWADIAQMIAEILGIDVKIDMSSPPEPRNQFSKEAIRSLGLNLDRGHDGIRDYLRALIAVMDE